MNGGEGIFFFLFSFFFFLFSFYKVGNISKEELLKNSPVVSKTYMQLTWVAPTRQNQLPGNQRAFMGIITKNKKKIPNFVHNF